MMRVSFILGLMAALLIGVLAHAANSQLLELNVNNTVNMRGAIMPASVADVETKLSELVARRGKDSYPIYVVINSPGGSIIAGESLIQFVSTLENIHTVTLFSASMAEMFAQGIPGKRYVTENGIFMDHRPSGGFEGQFAEGEVEEQLRFWKTIINRVNTRTSKRLKMSVEEYKARIVNEWWSEGQDAVDNNHADGIVRLHCSAELVAAKEVVNVRTFFGNAKLSYSSCPLLEYPGVEMQESESASRSFTPQR